MTERRGGSVFTPGGAAASAGSVRGADDERGSLTLEMALGVPVLFLLLMIVVHAAVFARDALLVQAAARDGARAAASSVSDIPVHAAIDAALGGRAHHVDVTPRGRRPGQVVHVTVGMTSQAAFGDLSLTASAAARVEPAAAEPP